VLFLVAIANLISKQIATIYGVLFTVALFIVFTVSEKINVGKMKERKPGLEEFNLDHRPEVTELTIHARPGCILVAVRDYNHMAHLHNVLEKTNLRRHDIAVMTVRPVMAGAGEFELLDDQLFSDYEKELFTRVVAVAEKEGKTLDLIVVPGVDPFDAMVQTAANVKASRLVSGVSAKMESDDLARQIGAGLGKAARAAASVLPGDHQPGPAERVRESGTASAAPLAGGPRPVARALAQAGRALRRQAAPSRRRGRSAAAAGT